MEASNNVLPRRKIITYTPESPKSGSPTPTKEDDLNRSFIDTASPIESVKEAGSKFGGMVRWKSNRTQATLERRKILDQDLEKLEEDMVVYKKRAAEAEEAKTQVLKELESTNRYIKELTLSLEKAQTEEEQAKQDYELARLRAEEMEHRIDDEASDAAKAQLEDAKAKHETAAAELESVSEELETLRKEYTIALTERDIAVKKAEEAVFESKEMEKKVEELTIELMATKESLESSQAAHSEAEEKRIAAAIALDQETPYWEKELKQTEEELGRLIQQINEAKDLKPKLDSASALLLDLKAELASCMEFRRELESIGHSNNASQTPEKRTQTDIPSAFVSAKKELEEVKLKIEKTSAEVDSLKSDLEKEKFSLDDIKQREEDMSVADAALKDDLHNTQSESATMQMNEEVDEAKSLSQMTHEEVNKVKEEAEQAKATMESKLLAAEKEIEAANVSEKAALAAMKAFQDSESAQGTDIMNSEDCVMLSLEEFYDLCKREYEAELGANMRLEAAILQVEVAKQSQSRSLEKLEEVNQEMAKRKELLNIALEKAEKAKEGKLGVEQELRQWRASSEQRRKGAQLSHGQNPSRKSIEVTRHKKIVKYVPTSPCSTLDGPRSLYGNNTESESSPEITIVKKKKKQLLPKIISFFSREKSSLLQYESKSKSKSK